MNLYHQLRIKGWIAITVFGVIGFLVNWLQGFDFTFVLLLASLFFLNGYIYIYNDYHDAPFDKLDPQKSKRNPFCGDDPERIRIGKIVMYGTPVLSVLLALFLPFRCAIWVFIVLGLGYIYSAPKFRCKERPFWDWFIHIFWLVLNFVPGYLYFFEADARFYIIAAICGTNSLISQINNELNDFVVDSLSKHRTTVIILGKRNTFYVRWALEFLLAFLIAWLAFQYEYYAVLAVLVPTFLYFLWIERIQVLDKIETLREFVKIRIGYVLTIWLAVWLMEAGLKKLI